MYDEYNVETCVAVKGMLYIRRSLKSEELLGSPQCTNTLPVSKIVVNSGSEACATVLLVSKLPFV